MTLGSDHHAPSLRTRDLRPASLRRTGRLRAGVSVAALVSVAVFGAACSKADPTSVSAEASSPTVPGVAITTPTIPKIPEATVPVTKAPTTSTTEKQAGTTTTKKAASTTTTAAKVKGGPEFAKGVVDLFKTKLGDFNALELIVWVQDNARSEVQVQDPAKPANVDQYETDGTKLEGPNPVKLSGDGDLEANLFSVTEVAWDQLPTMFEQAKTSIGALEGSTGVTHMIVKKNLPFDDATVVNIYVDGGTRSDGGYVSFNADGSVKKVFGPS